MLRFDTIAVARALAEMNIVPVMVIGEILNNNLHEFHKFQICIGSKILQIQIKPYEVYFSDTFNYIPLSLRKLANAFDLDIGKSFFPMKMLTPEFYGTTMEWPDIALWEPEKLVESDREHLRAWYEEEKVKYVVFNFNLQLELYCIVGTLLCACVKRLSNLPLFIIERCASSGKRRA